MRRDCSVCQGRLLFHPQVLRVNAQFRYDSYSIAKAAGAALGTIGIASYAGAGLGEFLTGIIIDKTAILENGKTLYDFSTLALFWVGTGLGSALLCFTTAAIVARRHAVERQTSFSS